MAKIDAALYESARIDGAGWFREFRSITVPSLRYEIGVCLTVTIIAALAAFDIVYVTTGGGPGNATAVPGIQIYILAFLERQVGLASALAVVLVILVLLVILPIQRLSRETLDEGRASGALRGSGAAGGAGRDHDPAVREHLHDGPLPVRQRPGRAVLAGRPAMGQLPRRLQGREHECAPRVERLHRSRCRADLARDLDDGRASRSACFGSRARGSCSCCSCSA